MAWGILHIFVIVEITSAMSLNGLGFDLTFLYGDTAWTAVTYTNSWVDFGAGQTAVGFRLIGTRVVLRGTMKSGTINTAAFTLPVGYRPPAGLNFPAVSNALFGSIVIASTGVVTPATGSNVWFSLDNISFDTLA